jgi:chromosome segregation ATPase
MVKYFSPAKIKKAFGKVFNRKTAPWLVAGGLAFTAFAEYQWEPLKNTFKKPSDGNARPADSNLSTENERLRGENTNLSRANENLSNEKDNLAKEKNSLTKQRDENYSKANNLTKQRDENYSANINLTKDVQQYQAWLAQANSTIKNLSDKLKDNNYDAWWNASQPRIQQMINDTLAPLKDNFSVLLDSINKLDARFNETNYSVQLDEIILGLSQLASTDANVSELRDYVVQLNTSLSGLRGVQEELARLTKNGTLTLEDITEAIASGNTQIGVMFSEGFQGLANNYAQVRDSIAQVRQELNESNANYSTLAGLYGSLDTTLDGINASLNALLGTNYSDLVKYWQENFTALEILRGAYGGLLQDFNILLASRDQLAQDFARIHDELADLSAADSARWSQLNNTLGELNNLTSRYVALNNSYGELQQSYSQLMQNYSALQNMTDTTYRNMSRSVFTNQVWFGLSPEEREQIMSDSLYVNLTDNNLTNYELDNETAASLRQGKLYLGIRDPAGNRFERELAISSALEERIRELAGF